MNKLLSIVTAITLSLSMIFMSIGYAELSDELVADGTAKLSSQKNVFISNVIYKSDVNAGLEDTSINEYTGTNLNSTIVLSPTNPSSSITYTVEFYNNSPYIWLYEGVDYLDAAYSNSKIDFSVSVGRNFISAYGSMTLDITFHYATSTITSNVLDSVLNFVFSQVDVSHAAVVEGNSADNLAAIYNGSKNYNGNNTQYRWTNWASSDSGDEGEPATINIIWEEAQSIDSIVLHHFVDAGAGNRNNNWARSCDFPESVTIYYYDDAVGDYVELRGTTVSKNYTNASRRTSDGVYTMTIDGKTASFTHSYNGTAPATTYDFSSINTMSIKIVIDPPDNYFVGLMELEVFDGKTNLLTD